jgi:glycosyltransferase involved in cell wall biosynthesis
MNSKIISRPKILCFVSHYLPGYLSGGPVKSISNLADHLRDHFEFFIITSDRDLGGKKYSFVKINSWNKVSNSNVYYASKSKLTLNSIAKLIRSTKHDILYLNSFFNFTFTTLPLIARRFMSVSSSPCVLAPRGEFSPAALNIKYWKKKFFIFLTNLFQLYSGLNWQAANKQELNNIFKIFKIYKKLVNFAPDLPVKINKLKKNYLSNNKKIKKKPGILNIIFLSRITPIKNLDFILKFINKINKTIRLSIYGPIEDKIYWKKCKRIIKIMPSNITVKYKGIAFPENIFSIFSAHDIFILPSGGESYGHVVIESLISGTPVIISDKTPWKNDGNKAITVLPLNKEIAWINEIEKWADHNQNTILKRSFAAKKFAKLYLLNKKNIIQNKNFFLSLLINSHKNIDLL